MGADHEPRGRDRRRRQTERLPRRHARALRARRVLRRRPPTVPGPRETDRGLLRRVTAGVQTLRGATVVDGTGSAGRNADVVIDGERIVDVAGPGTASDGDVIDLDGLALAPGFIDCHTHYDAQVLWDPDVTPSSWHGVTTVIVGNCGFGIAPTRPIDREMISRILENVEGMSI
ncbi:MAG: hypothetical protein E6G60_19315, partial [Actinobacteria bacterium]